MTTASRYSHLKQRVLNAPLMLEQSKLGLVLDVLSDRLEISETLTPEERAALLDRERARELNRYGVTTTPDGLRVINVQGTLVKRARGIMASSGLSGYEALAIDVREALDDPRVRGVVLNVDSPGGEAQGCFDLADQILAGRGAKPIYAVANSNAFSAAYLLASQAERVYVSQDGGVGSVGVYNVHVDRSGLDEKLGVKPTFVFAGARKLDGNPHTELPEEVRKRLQERVDKTYGAFVASVAKARGLTEAQVRSTEADVFYGQEALEQGLATHLGTLDQALDDMRQELKTMDELKTLRAENATLKQQATTLQATVDQHAATIQALKESNEALTAQITTGKHEAYLASLDAKVERAGGLPLSAEQRSQILEALQVNETVGKQLGEAHVTGRLAGLGAKAASGQKDQSMDPPSADESARKAFAKELAAGL